jgi:hypothetical protein
VDEPCPYCGGPVSHRTGADIYPDRPELHRGQYWSCDNCGARVGCRPGTSLPLGSLADSGLRYLRKVAHEEFDRAWNGGPLRRPEAYRWLREHFAISERDAHIGLFGDEACRELIRACRAREYREFARGLGRDRKRRRRRKWKAIRL